MSITQSAAVLSAKENALVGVALSIASGCKPCTERYVRAAAEAGACQRGIRLAIESALAAREAATAAMAAWAQTLQGEAPELDHAFVAPRALWQAIYASGSAFAQRDTGAIDVQVARARECGATRAQLIAVFAQARAILEASSSHAEAALGELEPRTTSVETAASGCACGSCS